MRNKPPRRLSKSTLWLQVGAGRGNSITLGIENCDLITIVGLVADHPDVAIAPRLLRDPLDEIKLVGSLVFVEPAPLSLRIAR